MSYTLDSTGALGANLVTINKTIKTVGQTERSVLYVDDLFYSKGLSISYTDVDGDTRTLSMGSDYELLYSIRGVIRDNAIFAAIVFKNFALDGTIAVTCQVLGGKWSLNLNDIRNKLESLSFTPGLGYWALETYVPLLNANSTPVKLDSFQALQAAQTAGGGNPVLLTVAVGITPQANENTSVPYLLADALADFNPAQCLSFVLTTDGVFLPIDSLEHVYTYDGSAHQLTDTVSYNGRKWVKTNTWTGGNLTKTTGYQPLA